MINNPKNKFEQDRQIAEDTSMPENERQAARLRQAFWFARYQPVRHSDLPADTFLALWANLSIISASRRWVFPIKQIKRDLARVFSQPQLLEALAAAGPLASAMLRNELDDSARVYFTSCRTDSNYSSVLFNFVKLKDNQIASKAAAGAAEGILLPLIMIGEVPWRNEMIAAICDAFPVVFPEFAEALENKIGELKPEIAGQIEKARRAALVV